MEINLADEKIVELLSPFSAQEIKERALAKRVDAFGQLAKFMQRARPDEIEISQVERRLEPFWYGAAQARYVYDRRHRYSVPVSLEVKGVTVYGQDLTAGDQDHAFSLEALDHCVEIMRKEMALDPLRGEEKDYSRYLSFPKRDISDLDSLRADGTVLVPPDVRSSYVVRKLVQQLMKTFQADKITEERIDVESVILYFRPVFAFEYYWKLKEKKSVVEFDALTGEARAESGQLKRNVVRVLENDALFDIGADAIGTVFPGVNVAVKLGRIAARRVVR
ncbi:MAG: hypothetical protein ACM3JD_18930 [Rudaea sp.]